MKTFHIQLITLVSTIILSLFFTLSSAFGQSIKLEEGTQIRLKLLQDLSSATAQAGQTIAFEVLDTVKIDGTVVIAEGAQALGTITLAEPKKSLGRAGKLNLRLEYVKAVDGNKIPIRATSVNQGNGKGVATGIAVGVSALVFFPAAPAFLLIKGKDITVPRGQHVDAFIDGTRVIDIPQQNSLAPGFGGTVAPVNTSSSANGKVCVVNVVSERGGDIEVNGVFLGSAPSTFQLPAGTHTITVKRSGYNPWVRTITVVPGNITLRVEFEGALVKASRRR
ncbi:MAG: PEGA domain-containing protein [Acidobacteria bacterium]|nr:PEGA domain-containing protein [Acidobacteriota bacterium]